jgi:hypothetical protein
MSNKKAGPSVWVVPKNDGYVVKTARHRGKSVRGATQSSAIAYARSLARANGSELIVQGRRGRIRFKDSHGSDPYPPKG